jgi:hypothetical protein
MSTNGGAYDTTGLYRSGSHREEEDRIKAIPPAAQAEVERMMKAFDDRAAFVACTLRPAASAVLAYSEYLMAVADLPREHQAVLDVLRRQAHTIVQGLTGLGDGEDGRAIA